jgi:hypothetical protein
MFWTKAKRTTVDFDRLMDNLRGDDFTVVTAMELLQVEGGRARVSSIMDDSARRLPTGEIRVERLSY